MYRLILMVCVTTLLAGCASATPLPTGTPETTMTPSPSLEVMTITPPSALPTATTIPTDIFTQMGINLPAPVCASLTQPQTEGPYYVPNSPERNSLFEEGMPGTRLILVGYVLDQDCTPLPNAWLDFWQADTNGNYDLQAYRLRGHQFTDAEGRYFLETVLPGLYQSRPIEHIHVKIRPEGRQEITSQLYFPNQPVEGLTVSLEERGDYVVGYFNFVVAR